MKKLYIPLIVLVLLFSQCNKEEPTQLITLKGYVTDLSNGDTIPNVKIGLRENRGSSFAGNALFYFPYTLDSVVSDENGAFSFSFLASERYTYCFEPIKENYWYSHGMTTESLGVPDHNRNVEVRLYPLTWLKVRIKNEAPAQTSDSIWYNGPHDRDIKYSKEWYAPIYSHDFGLIGEYIDTTFYVALKYDEAPLQYWDVTENGQTVRSFAYAGCAPLDTCQLNIFY